MTPKFLIVNADDFGLTPSVCEGIVEALRRKNISDFSILANASSFDYGIRLLKENGIRSCGVHLCFVDKETPLTKTPAYFGQNGHFLIDRKRLIFAYMTKRREVLEYLRGELKAQLKRVLDAGLEISHVDGHQHLHLLPGVAEITLDLCQKFKIPFVRVPSAERNSVSSLAVFWLGRRMKRLAAKREIRCIESIGFLHSGKITPEAIQSYLNAAKNHEAPAFELMTHPGLWEETLDSKYGHWGYQWNKELDALKSIDGKSLNSNGFRLVNFSELHDAMPDLR